MGISRESEVIVNCHSQQANKGFGHTTVGHTTEFFRSMFKASSHEMSSNSEKVGR